jgi:hypothetical protein
LKNHYHESLKTQIQIDDTNVNNFGNNVLQYTMVINKDGCESQNKDQQISSVIESKLNLTNEEEIPGPITFPTLESELKVSYVLYSI